ncbi:MAG: branched-chain amino acid transaminase [Thermoanaerobaculia bacterium]
MNGKLVPFEQANIHVMTHALHYGSAWFEGIRCYDSPRGPAVFRLHEHMDRLVMSCRMYRGELPFTVDELCQATLDTLAANELTYGYIRPIAFRGFGSVGVNPLGCPIDVAIVVWPWGAYLGEEALKNGIDVCVSSWRRTSSESMPSFAKAAGGYLNSQLIKMEAVLAGYAEGIALDQDGFLSEGSGENLFLVKDDTLYTPPLSCSLLPGITRDSVIHMAADFGIPVREERMGRNMLYACDEMFLTGTAAEITPVKSVDRIPVRSNGAGPITRRLQDRFFAIVHGEIEDRHGWLMPVPSASSVSAERA